MDSYIPQLISLDGEWEFCYRNSIDCTDEPNIPKRDEFTAIMPVPGYWDDHIEGLKDRGFWQECRFNPDYQEIQFPMADMPPDASLPYLVGVGYYRKKVFVEDLVSDQAVTLSIGGVVLEAWIWVNGELAGYHLGHSTEFTVSLDEHIKTGEDNELIIAVANVRRDRSGCVLRGYKGLSAGIYRSVYLKISNHISIEDLYIYPSHGNQRLNWNIDFKGQTDREELRLNWAIVDTNEEILGSGIVDIDSQTLEMQTGIFGMKQWSDNSPNLYRIELTLYESGEIVDSLYQSFGLRTLSVDGTGLELNGRPIFLRGATEHGYFPLTCTPPSEFQVYRGNIERLRELGFNWLRFHTWVPSEEYMRAADELGMLIQVEGPVGFESDEWIDILRACRRHPSVVIYCCGNEELLDEEKIENLREMAQLCKTYAPDSLFNPQEALRGIEYCWDKSDMGRAEDVVSEPFIHNAKRLEAVKEFSDVFGQYTWGLLSYESTKGDWREIDRKLDIYERPCLSHENGIHGNYLNLDLEHRYEGTRIGTRLYSSARQYLKEEGVLDRAPLYYRNSCHWMGIVRKHNLETARKCNLVSGYDLLGAIDYHWHRCGYPCGILNEFYEMKPGESIEDVLDYNGESVLLLDNRDKVNFNFGDIVEFPILLSLYGEEAIEEGMLYWHLADESRYVYERGQLSVRDVRLGRNTVLGTIELAIPRLEAASKLTLSVRLSGGSYEIKNSWNIWAFPKYEKSILPEDVKLVSYIDKKALDFLEGGGRVVLMGKDQLPTLPTSFQPSVTGRTNGNLATVIYDHHLTDHFPHNGYCDWQFRDMLEGGSGVVFNDIDIPFDPIVEIVSSFKRVKRQAALFEVGVGAGRLLVCTLNLNTPDPASSYMLNLIKEYAVSDTFNPRRQIEVDALETLLKSNQGESRELSTDQAFDINAQLKK